MTALFSGNLPSKLPSAAEMAAMDVATIAAGTSSSELMEKAGREMVRVILEIVAANKPLAKNVLVLGGPGNNGGDGCVVARLLAKENYTVSVVLAAASSYSVDLLAKAKEVIASDIPLFLCPDGEVAAFGAKSSISFERLRTLLENCDLVIDALLGTGQGREKSAAPRGAIAEILNLVCEIRGCRAKDLLTVSLDLPSGTCPNTGSVYSPAISADFTIAVQLAKRGQSQFPLRQKQGELIVVPIGINTSLESEFELIEPAKITVPDIQDCAHKGNRGHVLVIGGSYQMPGAAVLSAFAALRAGAGLVTLAVPAAALGIVRTPPELMLCPLRGSRGAKDECLFLEHLLLLKPVIEKSSAVVVGPGLGLDAQKEALLAIIEILTVAKKRFVLDADALNIIAPILPRDMALSVLTPHPAEMGRLLNIGTEEVQGDRFRAAKSLSELTAGTVILKGAGSIVYGEGRGYVAWGADNRLATAGSGDVLAGIVGSFMAQGLEPLEAAKSGVIAHLQTAKQSLSPTLTASDLIGLIPAALGRLKSSLSAYDT